jgi:hypothetical protein
MYNIQVRPDSGQELAQQLSPSRHHRSKDRDLFLIQFLKSFICFDQIRPVALILAGVTAVFVSGCGGLVLNPGSSTSLSGDRTKSTQPSLTQISCGTQSLTGPQSKGCSVYLSGSTSKVLVVQLRSSKATLAVPSTVIVLAGASSAGFTAVSATVSSAQSVTLTATTNGKSISTAIELYPVSKSPTSASLSNISCGATILTGAVTKACSVYLNAPAGNQFVVALSSNNSAVTLPGSLTVPSGATSAGFTISAAAVAKQQTATLTASAGGVSQTDILQLNPSSSSSGPPPSHEVDLDWDAPSSSAVKIAGYRIYRSSGSSSSYQLLNGSVDVQTAYVDSTVQSGASYGYVVTTVSSSGAESSPSNSTRVTIP